MSLVHPGGTVAGLQRPSSGHVVLGGALSDDVPARSRGVSMPSVSPTVRARTTIARDQSTSVVPRGAEKIPATFSGRVFHPGDALTVPTRRVDVVLIG